MTNVSMSVPTRRVEMWFSGTLPQRRVTVVFRLILAIPQVFVLVFLVIAGFFVAVIGWFAALFTGRLPDFAHNYLSGLVRWEIRVNAYVLLLTDQYPPFSFDDMDYPVRPILPAPGPLNRVAVLFRLILAVPAAVFAQIVNYGLTVPLIIAMWVVVIVTGRMPPTLYTTYAALVRYQARLGAWFNMLTSEYAWGMFGDFVPPQPAAPPPPIGAVAGRRGAGRAATATASRGLRPARHPRRTSRRRSRSRTRRPASRRRHPRRTPGPPRRRPDGHPRSRPRPPGHPAFPGPCRRPPPGSAPRSRPRWSRCRPGGSSSCRVRRRAG